MKVYDKSNVTCVYILYLLVCIMIVYHFFYRRQKTIKADVLNFSNKGAVMYDDSNFDNTTDLKSATGNGKISLS